MKYRTIDKLNPLVQTRFEEFIKLINEKTGQVIRISETYRDKDQQESCVSKGTSWVHYPYSAHNWGLAIDIYRNDNGRTSYDLDWDTVFAVADSLNIDSGYKMWKVDKPHFQYTDGHSIGDIVINPNLIESFKVYNKKSMNKLSFVDIINKIPYSRREQEDYKCVTATNLACVIGACRRNKDVIKTASIDNSFDDYVEGILGRSFSRGAYMNHLVEALKKGPIELDCGDYIIVLTGLIPLERDVEVYKRRLNMGSPVILSMNYKAYDYNKNMIKKATPFQEVTNWGTKHNAVLIDIQDDIALYADTDSDRRYGNYPSGVKGISLDFLSIKGNLQLQGIYKAYSPVFHTRKK